MLKKIIAKNLKIKPKFPKHEVFSSAGTRQLYWKGNIR